MESREELIKRVEEAERKATEARKAAVEATQRFEELRETHTKMVGQILELMGKLETLR